MKLNKRIACCLTIRNCADYLDKIFLNLNLLSAQFTDFYVICVFDNCTDATEQILLEYQRTAPFKVIVFKHSNDSPYRTVRISDARNICLQLMNPFHVDFHFMIDADDVNIQPWNIDIIRYYLGTEDWDSLSFNRPDYYDIWALLYNNYKQHCYAFVEYYPVVLHIKADITSRLRVNDDKLFDCLSAFNGFAMYRTSVFNNIVYDGTYEAFKTIVTEEDRLSTLQLLQHELNKPLPINPHQVECCEHLFYHISAIQKNNARIRISKQYLTL